MSKQVASTLNKANRSALRLWSFIVAWMLSVIGFAGCCKIQAMEYGSMPDYGIMPLYGVMQIQLQDAPAEEDSATVKEQS